MRKLGAPLRLTWDWDWPPIAHPGAPARRPPPERVRTIGAEIVRARVLMLEVGYPDPDAVLSGELSGALEGFTGSLALVIAPAAAGRLGYDAARRAAGAEEIWLDATPGAGPSAAGLEGWPSVRFHLTAGNADAVAAAIEHAVSAGAAAISLPNLPLFGDVLRVAETVSPSLRQLERLAARIAAALRDRPDVAVHVHHYGLWRFLQAAGVHPHGEGEPGAGCQAGSALAYVDPTGILYPCASLPVPLASVKEGAIREAWSAPTVRALREGVARRPAACESCLLFEQGCRGGCRGWAHYLAAAWEAVGPDCVGPSSERAPLRGR